VRHKPIETFYWVATIGNFHSAAERLNTTQPAISARIRALEAELGVELFDRTPRSAKLNSAGRRFLVYAERFMALTNEVEQTFMSRDNISRIVRIGVSETVANTWFMDFMAEVNRLYPRMNIEMVSDISLNLRHQVLHNEIDIAFMLGPIDEPGTENHILSRCDFVWVASPSLRLPRTTMKAADVAAYTIITFLRRTPIFETINAALKAANVANAKVHCSTSIRTILHMVLQGWGIAALPKQIVDGHLPKRELRVVDVCIRFEGLTYTASYLRSPSAPLYAALSEIAREAAKRGATTGLR
jgi:DNA-binding transcriptional LysR family regulator